MENSARCTATDFYESLEKDPFIQISINDVAVRLPPHTYATMIKPPRQCIFNVSRTTYLLHSSTYLLQQWSEFIYEVAFFQTLSRGLAQKTVTHKRGVVLLLQKRLAD